MASSGIDLIELEARLSRLSTVDEKLAVLKSLDTRSKVTGNINSGGNNVPNPAEDPDIPGLWSIISAHPGLPEAYGSLITNAIMDGTAAVNCAIRQQPCANIDAARRFACPIRGSLLCSSCQLVHYCSKVCQELFSARNS